MKARWPVVLLSVAVLLGSCVASNDDDAIQVGALWYGHRPDGSVAYGVSDVAVSATHGDSLGVTVDDASTQTGPIWQATSRMAAAMGVLGSGLPASGTTVHFRGGDDLDGPSAGALLTSAVLAALVDSGAESSVTMTGTVLPSGALGAVSGIPEKVRAAARDGYRTVLIPKGQGLSRSLVTGVVTDVRALGRGLGIDVREVATVREAFTYVAPSFTGPPVASAVMSATVEAFLKDQAIVAAELVQEALTTWTAEYGAQSPNAARAARVLDDFAHSSPRLPSAVAASIMFSAAQALEMMRMQDRSASSTLQDALALRDQATDTLRRECGLTRATLAEPRTVEQIAAYSDVVAGLALVCSEGNTTTHFQAVNSSRSVLDEVNARLAGAIFHIRHLAPLAWGVATRTGFLPLGDNAAALVEQANSYVQIMGDASQANAGYARSLMTLGMPDGFTVTGISPEASTEPVVSIAAVPGALGEVTRTFTVTGAEVTEVVGRLASSDDPWVDVQALELQFEAAHEESLHAAEVLAGAQADPSYVLWSTQSAQHVSRWAAEGDIGWVTRSNYLSMLQGTVSATLAAGLLE